MSSLPPQIGRYQILGLLGTGGMAEVFLGRLVGPSGFERPVVIKRILPHLAREQHFRDMFLDEARIVAGIRHQNVVTVHELCKGTEDVDLYMVMEYLEGESAAGLARRLSLKRKLLSFGLAAHVVSEVCNGLHAAHNLKDAHGRPQNLVHRDVSPANIFVTYEGGVKILDFGIAMAADRVSRTEAGQVKGKYAYMSPEQCKGKPLDRRSDVFSLGTVLYEISTCRRLFKRDSDMLTLQAICSDEITPPSKLVGNYPPALEAVIMKALERDREKRYQSALEMRRDLLEVSHALNEGKIPEESLARVMSKLFTDRIEQKRSLLARIESGSEVSQVVAAEADESVEIPAAASFGEEMNSSSAVSIPPAAAFGAAAGRRRSGWWVGAAAAALMVIGGTAAFTAASRGVADADDGRAALPAAPAEPPPPSPSEPKTVRLALESEPPGARVYVDELPRGETPVTLELDRGERPVALRVTHDGFLPVEETVVPDVAQKLRLVLVEKPKPKVARESKPKRRRRPAPEPAVRPAPEAEVEPSAPVEAEDPYKRFN